MHLYESGDGLKHEKGEDTLLELSSLMTELRKIWAVIQKEDTEHVDPYGYDVMDKSLIVYSKERA